MKYIMNNIRFLLGRQMLALLAFGGVVLSSCTKKFKEINTDKNAIATVGPAELPFLFSKAESAAPGSQWNYQVAENLFSDQYCQYFACVATYFQSDRLFIRQDWVGAAFNPMYTDVLPQLQSIFANTDSLSAEHALAEVWWVYTFHRVTDYWGPIPYFQAGQPAVSVPYDPQDKIYDDFFKRLDAAAAVLKTQTGATPYGSFDLVYGGDVKKWLKFCNTLRLRLAMRISKVDPARAKSEGEAAIADGLLQHSPADDALVQRSTKGSDGNGLAIMSDWNEFRMSSAMASVLNGYNDPRTPVYFIEAVKGGGGFKGVRNGLSVAQLGLDPNTAGYTSHVGPRWASTDAGGITTYLSTPQNVMATAEAYFLLAEAATLGWNTGGMTAQQAYEAGITESMHQWGITDAAKISAYIGSSATPTAPGDGLSSPAVSNVPINWSSDPAMQLQQIATQKWLAIFPDGMEGWADWRRSHVMKLYTVVNSENTDIPDPSKAYIRRINFLTTEIQNNPDGVAKGVSELGGPDKVTTPLWWDKNP